MATGVLIAESLQVGAELDVHWRVKQIVRASVTNLSGTQLAAGLPSEWTVLQIELPDANARALAHPLADKVLRTGWCAEFDTDAETLSVFAGRGFRS